MTVDILQDQIREQILNEDNLFDILDILSRIISDNDEKSILFSNKTRLNLLKSDQSRGIIPYEDFNLNRSKIVDVISQLVNNRLDESILIPDWEKNESLLAFMPAEEESIEVYSEEDQDETGIDKDPENQIALPKYDITIPAEVGKDSAVKREFRLQMQRAQNGIRAGSYEEAYSICIDIATKIEGDSAQLQEFLMISLFKKSTVVDIVKDYLEGQGILFSRLKLYAERLIKLDNLVPGTLPRTSKLKSSETGATNIRRICKLLIEEVKKCYKRKEFDGRKFDYIASKEKPEIREYYTKLIQLAMSIYALWPIPVFSDLLLLELAGGGYMDWLIVDQNMNIKDRDRLKFSPKYEIKLLRETYAPKMFSNFYGTHFEKRAARALFEKLKAKYRAIERVKNAQGHYVWTEEKNIAVYRMLQAFQIGYKLYQDNGLLKIPLEELKGAEKLDWFDLDADGRLMTDKYIAAALPKFDPIAQLRMIAKILRPEDPESILNDTRQLMAQKKFNKLKREYERLCVSGAAPKSKAQLNTMIQQIKTCHICYKTHPDPEFLRFGIFMLKDTRKAAWMQSILLPGLTIRVNLPVCLDLNFDAVREMVQFEELLHVHQQANQDQTILPDPIILDVKTTDSADPIVVPGESHGERSTRETSRFNL